MKVRKLGANRTLLQFDNGTEVLFSYETPVAGYHAGTYFRTDTRCSVTTSKHISQYLRGINAVELPQARINEMGRMGS